MNPHTDNRNALPHDFAQPLPYRRFTRRVSGECLHFSTATRPVVEPWPVCLKNQG